MNPPRYYPPRYFAPRYFPGASEQEPGGLFASVSGAALVVATAYGRADLSAALDAAAFVDASIEAGGEGFLSASLTGGSVVFGLLTATGLAPVVFSGGWNAPRRRFAIEEDISAAIRAACRVRANVTASAFASANIAARGSLQNVKPLTALTYEKRTITRQDNQFWALAA